MLNILMIVQQDAVQCTEHTAWCNQRNVGLVKCTSIDIGRNVYFCVNFVINVEAFIVHRISHFIFYMIAEHLFPAQLPTAPRKPQIENHISPKKVQFCLLPPKIAILSRAFLLQKSLFGFVSSLNWSELEYINAYTSQINVSACFKASCVWDQQGGTY